MRKVARGPERKTWGRGCVPGLSAAEPETLCPRAGWVRRTAAHGGSGKPRSQSPQACKSLQPGPGRWLDVGGPPGPFQTPLLGRVTPWPRTCLPVQ